LLYKQHCITNLSIGILFTACLSMIDCTRNIIPWVFASSYVLSTFLLSPDLDLHHSSPTQNWGFLKMIWWPYSKLFKHRGLSHAPLLGTGSRLLYLCTLACLCALIYDLGKSVHEISWSSAQMLGTTRMEEFFSLFKRHENQCISFLAGTAASDLSHLFLDAVSSFLKRL